ncbi:MAG TPA: CoA ester lyase [Woeseiaceae bacterium]|nr:CoA ester lyase [Woeseiaceae bacterium]
MIRSFLFVPGDSERKLEKAAGAGADAVIVDLEDSVSAENRPRARELAREYIDGREDVWLRINPVDSGEAMADLQAVMPAAPSGIVLPKARSADDATRLATKLDELESRFGIAAGQTRILPLCTERPRALFSLDSYVGATPRLAGLTWGAEDLSAALGARASRDEDGNWLPPYELARSLCLFAAAAAEVPAIDTVYTDFRDANGLASFAARAARDGFTGMLAIHPAQVTTINSAFSPSDDDVQRAEHIIALFRDNPGAGTLALDGEMIDKPHLVQARRIVGLARRLKTKEKG